MAVRLVNLERTKTEARRHLEKLYRETLSPEFSVREGPEGYGVYYTGEKNEYEARHEIYLALAEAALAEDAVIWGE